MTEKMFEHYFWLYYILNHGFAQNCSIIPNYFLKACLVWRNCIHIIEKN